jgi:pimeloyl-ACP methyl ester carboxylesterase
MHRVNSGRGVTVSYEKKGSGPPLVLVHGAFSDHRTNWEFVLPFLSQQFTVYAVARRGRGETVAAEAYSPEDESRDTIAVIDRAGAPVFLLGHSYGAQVALAAASMVPDKIRKLVLYEPPGPGLIGTEMMASLEAQAYAGDWDGFAVSFFGKVLSVPLEELEKLRGTELWPPIIADAKASLCDLRALGRYKFHPERFRELQMPVLLQVGTESPRALYVTDALFEVLPDVRIGELEGQAHEGMTTAPQMYAEAVTEFLLAPQSSLFATSAASE